MPTALNTEPPTLAAVVLAAGGSTRMGHPKALLEAPNGETLLRAWLDRFRAIGAERVVVVGAVVTPIAALLSPEERLVHNPGWAETGPYDSLRLGLAALDGARRVLVTPVDVPPAPLPALRRLLQAPGAAVLAWQGTPGHPALLDAGALAAVREGPVPPGGLASLLGGAMQVEADGPEVTWNLNTPEDYARWRAQYSGT